jgi:NAD(P)-dependent dehydrogenase (short-subunit alcohol dehydrogenase family)
MAGVIDTKVEDWERVLNTNLRGMFFTSKHAIPYMQKQGGGAIVNIASIGSPRASAHAATPRGRSGLSRQMAVDYPEQHPHKLRLPDGDRYAAHPQRRRRASSPAIDRGRTPAAADRPAGRYRLGGSLPGLGGGALHHRGGAAGGRGATRFNH